MRRNRRRFRVTSSVSRSGAPPHATHGRALSPCLWLHTVTYHVSHTITHLHMSHIGAAKGEGDRFSTAKSRLNRLALEPWGVAAAVSLRSHGYYLHALWRYTALHSITSGIRALHSINADKRAL